MGARNRVVLARQATQPGGIGSLESILGLLKSLKSQVLDTDLALFLVAFKMPITYHRYSYTYISLQK
jgi:hypothetical protein